MQVERELTLNSSTFTAPQDSISADTLTLERMQVHSFCTAVITYSTHAGWLQLGNRTIDSPLTVELPDTGSTHNNQNCSGDPESGRGGGWLKSAHLHFFTEHFVTNNSLFSVLVKLNYICNLLAAYFYASHRGKCRPCWRGNSGANCRGKNSHQ